MNRAFRFASPSPSSTRTRSNMPRAASGSGGALSGAVSEAVHALRRDRVSCVFFLKKTLRSQRRQQSRRTLGPPVGKRVEVRLVVVHIQERPVDLGRHPVLERSQRNSVFLFPPPPEGRDVKRHWQPCATSELRTKNPDARLDRHYRNCARQNGTSRSINHTTSVTIWHCRRCAAPELRSCLLRLAFRPALPQLCQLVGHK